MREGHGEGLLTGLDSRYVRAVFWLRRPPYLRWISAAVVLAVGLFLDTRPVAVVDYPFTTADIHAGGSIADQIEWRRVPVRLLPPWDRDVEGYAAADLTKGTPLLPDLVAAAPIPEGWWSVAITLPHPVGPGTQVRVPVGGAIVTGLLSGEVVDNGYEYVGPVAFPADNAALVAEAVAAGEVVVMLGPASSIPGSAG